MGARKPWEPSRMRTGPDLTVQDVLDVLVSGGIAPSNMGAQLERIRDKALRPPDKTRAKDFIYDTGPQQAAYEAGRVVHVRSVVRDVSCIDAAEQFALMHAPVLRCIDALCEAKDSAAFRGRTVLKSLHERTGASFGSLTIGALRVYQERASKSQERGLAEVFVWRQRLLYQPADDANVLAQQFREGKAKKSRSIAAELYADCMLVLMRWVSGAKYR